MNHTAHAAWVRPLGALLTALLVAVIAARFVPLALAAPIAWVVFVAVYVIWTWAVLSPMSPDETKTHATREDPSRTVATGTLLVASIASIGGVALLLAAGAKKESAVLEALMGATTVAASWLLVHVVYMLHYARIYYSSPPKPAPIDYNEDPEGPDYHDFAYLALTMGMTYQVSDTNLNTKSIRRVVLRHALLSYLLGAIVLACTVNLIASLAAGSG